MDIVKHQQHVIKELRQEVAEYKRKYVFLNTLNNAKYEKLIALEQEQDKTRMDLKWYKVWTYAQLIIITAIALPKTEEFVRWLKDLL